MNRIKVGVVGCGYWGPNLIRNFVSIPSSEVIVVADLQPERLNHIKSIYPRLEVRRDYREIFDLELDAAVVATPPATHYRIAKDCLTNGLHTFVEKPITLDSGEAEDLIQLADERDLTLMVGHTFEYNNAVRKLKEIIASGDLGKIFYIDMVRVNLGLFQSDLNVVWDLAPHDISILAYILGMQPLSVSAHGEACLVPHKYDIAYLNLKFPERILAHVHVSWLDPNKVRRTTVVGSKKMLVYDDLEPLEKIKIYDKGVETPPYTDTYDDFQYSYRYGDIVIPYIQFTEPLRIECQDFLDSIEDENRSPQSSGQVGVNVLKVLEAAQRSLDNYGVPEFIGDGNLHESAKTANLEILQKLLGRENIEWLYDINSELGNKIDVQTLFERLIRLSVERVGASSGSLLFQDDANGRTGGIVIHDGEIYSYSSDSQTDLLQQGLAGWVYKNQTPTIVHSTDEDPRWVKRDWEVELDMSRSAISLPVKLHGNELVGVLTLVKGSNNQFDQEHLNSLSAITNFVAMANVDLNQAA
ncbi:MAG: Gfo/Idh/MocA family oxidoreductase [Candidatus Hermodarchaeia archaeon]|jgi:predicted dehydrogenase